LLQAAQPDAPRQPSSYTGALAPSGLTVTQYSLLAHALRRDAAPTLSELASSCSHRTAHAHPQPQAARRRRPASRSATGAMRAARPVLVTAKGRSALRAARPCGRAQAAPARAGGCRRLAALHGLIDELLHAV